MKIFALLLLFCLAGCGIFTPPVPLAVRMGTDTIDSHNPSAKQGWDDGCNSGYAVYGNHYYKAWYDFKRDPTKVGDKQYEMNWYEGYNYCRQIINTQINDGVF